MSKIEVQLLDIMGSDRAIAEAAWTSSTTHDGKAKRPKADVARVINMMADECHGVPFESVIFKFWMRMPIFTDRQHVTHRIASHNGLSGRYRTPPTDCVAIPQDVVNIGETNPEPLMTEAQYNEYTGDLGEWFRATLNIAKLQTNAAEYRRFREFTRGVLPQASMTERVTIINLRSWANYIRLRLSEHAQPEIREVARQMYNLVTASNACPLAIEALDRNGWTLEKPNFSVKEIAAQTYGE